MATKKQIEAAEFAESLTEENVLEKPIDSVLPFIIQGVMEWKSAQTEEAIKTKVKELLESKEKEVTLQLLGFSNRWGTWEINNSTNGKLSPVQEYFHQQKTEAIKEFFDGFDLKGLLTPALKKKLQAEIRKEVEWRLQSQIKETASDMVKKRINELMETVVSSNNLDKTVALLKAIQ